LNHSKGSYLLGSESWSEANLLAVDQRVSLVRRNLEALIEEISEGSVQKKEEEEKEGSLPVTPRGVIEKH
jgi:hypothetical protein